RTAYERILPAPLQEHYPLSHAQQRLWILQQMSEEQQAYNIPRVYYMNGRPDVAKLQRSLQQLIRRHEILRTVFRPINGEVRQVVLSENELPRVFHFISAEQLETDNISADQFIRDHINYTFHLEHGPLLQTWLVQSGPDRFIFLMNMHHIISDGWSATILLAELIENYNHEGTIIPVQRPELPIQYKDYACWEQQYLTGERGTRHKNFWLENLAGDIPRISLPETFARPAKKSYRGDACYYQLSSDLTQQLKVLSEKTNASMFMLLMSAFNTLFYRYLGIEDVVIGTVVAGREKAELSGQVGFYVNTLAIRTKVSGEDSFRKLVERVRENMFKLSEHQYYPFDKVISDLGLPADASRSSLFDIMFVYQNNDELTDETLSIDGIVMEETTGQPEGSKFDISFVASERQEKLNFYIEYNTDVYDKAFILRFMQHFSQLLESIVIYTDQPLAHLSYLSQEELKQLHSFNQTAYTHPLSLPAIQSYFEYQVMQQPDRPAIFFEEEEWSYADVNGAANQLAHWIRSECPELRDRVIAFVADRSPWQLIMMLGILKSGAAFLPIDPSNPPERIAFMLEDAAPVLVITDTTAIAWDNDTTFPVKTLAAIQVGLGDFEESDPGLMNTSEDLAYLIYTSGSTGTPKGVMIPHRGTINMALDQSIRFELTPADRSLQFATISFDAAVYEIFMALFAGSAIVVLKQEIINQPNAFLQYIEQCGVTIATLPPAYLVSLGKRHLKNIRILITAGEAPHADYAFYYNQYLKYYNAYGPTEYSVCTTVHQVRGDEGEIPAGRPLSNTQLYILDDNQQLLPVGFLGEITVSGEGIARGYLNRPGLTNEKFIDHPFKPGQKLYRTGDIGRWNPDGTIVFAGRKDSLVKIRGYRVELAEIEQVLLTHPAVKIAVVTYKKEANERDALNAYMVADNPPDPREIKAWLAQKLPHYMIPGYICFLEVIPLTSNGKINYSLLPVPSKEGELLYKAIAPQNELEETLLDIWKAVLGMEVISVEDDFFSIGGQSILAMQLMSKIWDRTGKNISIRDLVKYPTIRGLAAFISHDAVDKGLLLPLSRAIGGNRKLFMIPPVVGSATVFKHLSAQLEEVGINCYGLQYRGFDYEDNFDVSIDSMAESFAREILKVAAGTTEKKYILGYSMGALLAMETAWLLEAAGHHVNVILLDKDPLAGLGDLRIKGKKVNTGKQYLEKLFELHFKHVAHEILLKDMERIQKLLAHNLSLLENYLPDKQLRSDILAIEAAGTTKKNKMLKWETYTEGKFEHLFCEGDHFSIIREENTPVLADNIARFMLS
ncbi:amino acid adenylation domain-containing protein, partial [Chitinophaga sp. 30R24]|uniref:non-ribosomal peptide synthetase n=1 Tax=Chitinophaga sp. 30R24 TaxID=3248838 RepID=UPI003B912E33